MTKAQRVNEFNVMYPVSGARGSVVVKALYYKLEDHGLETRRGQLIFSIYLILPAALGPEVHSVSNRKEYQQQKQNVLGSRARPVPTSESRLSTQCGILNISQPYRPQRPATGIVLISISFRSN
jgi:hypothetical protein